MSFFDDFQRRMKERKIYRIDLTNGDIDIVSRASTDPAPKPGEPYDNPRAATGPIKGIIQRVQEI